MSGNLARYLAGALTKSAPPGWRGVSAEHNLFSRELAERVGYSPAADLVVENTGQGRRIWVEFEISRADPVANHAKFAVAHLVQQFDDTFVSMVSTHVVAGRRALCAHAVTMMRRLGLDAFQTSLLPQLDGNSIKRLNHLTVLEISRECPPVDAEWDRLLAVATPFADRAGVRILLIGDPAEAAWNVHQWNLDLSTDIGRGQWAGKRGFRAVEHFIWWPPARLFAPCKFAAFVPAGGAFGMNMALYASLSESEALFDGRRAWMHVERIGFSRKHSADPFWAIRARHVRLLGIRSLHGVVESVHGCRASVGHRWLRVVAGDAGRVRGVVGDRPGHRVQVAVG